MAGVEETSEMKSRTLREEGTYVGIRIHLCRIKGSLFGVCTEF